MIAFLNRHSEHLTIAALLGFTFWVFYPSVHCELINWDDPDSIIENKYITSLSLENILAMFTSLDFFQPLVNLSFAIEYHFWGNDARVFHLTNVLLHLLNVLLVYCFIRLISKQFTVAFIAAALFALHPLRIESVTWATERKDVLYALFLFLSLIFYTKYSMNVSSENYNARRTYLFYMLAFFFCLLSLLSKVMAATTGLMIILIDLFFGRKWNKKAFLDKIPFLLLPVFFIIISLLDIAPTQEDLFYAKFNFFERIQNSSYAALWYIYKTLVPFNLSAHYTFPDFEPGNYPLWFLSFPLLLISTVALWLYFGFVKGKRKLAFGFGFYLAAIILTVQLWAFGVVLVADRYSYVASVGLFYLAGECLNRLGKKFIIIALILILPLSYLSKERIKVWQNSVTFWSDIITKHPDLAKAYYAFGNTWLDLHKYSNAIENYTICLQKNPSFFEAYNNRGFAKQKLGDFRGAENDYFSTLRINPNYIRSYSNLGSLMVHQHRFTEAVRYLNISIYKNISGINDYYMRGCAWFYLGKYKKAIDDLNLAISLNPKNSGAFFFRGSAAYGLSDTSGACNDWKNALLLGEKEATEALKSFCR